MKHKTQDLTGALLDAAVALADGASVTMGDGELVFVAWPLQPGRICWADWRPSTSWGQGGQIIERERITVVSNSAGGWSAFNSPAVMQNIAEGLRDGAGETALIAAMRAYVAAKLGAEVEL